MRNLIIVNDVTDWDLRTDGLEAVTARAYLTDPEYQKLRNAKVFNLCRSYRYKSIGYYVSLLAGARGHKPMPSVSTMLDFRNQTLVRFVSDDLDELIQESLKKLRGDKFTLSMYFGKNVTKSYDRLSQQLFKLFPSPFLRAQFRYSVSQERWQMTSIGPVASRDIPEEHKDFVATETKNYFSGKRASLPKQASSRYDLAILYDPKATDRPSNPGAVQKFVKAAENLDLSAEVIGKDDFGRLAEFDALFIRETTSVHHYTYRFSRRAHAEGLVVIDDPFSILACTNKVYLAELMTRHGVAVPRTMIVHKHNLDQVQATLGLPCILKDPESSFSRGVIKVDDPAVLQQELTRLLEKSDLIIAQEFLPSSFDWRIGIIDRKPIFACKYFMAKAHWQIAKHERGQTDYGKVEALPVEVAPQSVVRAAKAAAELIGDGLYGVDLKEIDGKPYVIEVNENPNVDAGFEDSILKDDLYERIMRVFLERIEARKERRGSGR